MRDVPADSARLMVICPNLACGKPVAAPDSRRGRLLRCVHCGTVFIVARSGDVRQKGGAARPT